MVLMLIDTHAHVNFSAYKNDADEVIRRALENKIWMINVGSQYSTSKRAVEIAESYPEGIYAAVGLHPIHLKTGLVHPYAKKDPNEAEAENEEGFDYEKYKALALSSKKVVAVGEVGLDYYWKPKTKKKLELFKEKQRTVLCKQLDLVKELNLPVIFHCRMAHQDLYEILNLQLTRPTSPASELAGGRATYNLQLRGVMHGFVGTAEQLKKYLKMGFYIGFNGIIFKKIEGIDFEENIKETPLERTLIETDCPYLTPPISVNQFTPTPNFGVGASNQHKSAFIRNEPLYIKYVVEKIAEVKKISFEEVAEKTCQNAKDLFQIP